MGLDTILVTGTDRGTMLPDITGDLPVTSITGVLIGAIAIGDTTAGTGIKTASAFSAIFGLGVSSTAKRLKASAQRMEHVRV
jgi:hypothetical protein